jgi:cytochrome b subunit of formate dehydrogenase
MKNTSRQDLAKKTVIWLLAIVTVLYLVSGVGITEARIVETATFGLLSKNVAFIIHDNLWIPFITLLVLHVCLQLIFKRKAKEAKP